MRQFLLLAGLLATGALGACDLAKQPFSCAPGLSTRLIGYDQTPATRDANGYYHC